MNSQFTSRRATTSCGFRPSGGPKGSPRSGLGRMLRGRGWWAFPLRLHRDQQGVISILSVFAMLMLAAVLGMVMNVGRQIDGKIRLQNAADAAAYSGGVMVARGMNVVAFSNHLLCEVFALTALMREGRDQHSDKYIPDILSAWKKAGEIFQKSPFPKFKKLGQAIIQQVPLERDLSDAFSAWAKATSELILPTFEEILAQRLIPEFQDAVVKAYPDMAQEAALRAALANGRPNRGRGDLCAALWRTSVVPVGGAGESILGTLPAIDPTDPSHSDRLAEAHQQRDSVANNYMSRWNSEVLRFFDRRARMCNFATLWRGFTCGQLHKLLDEYPDSNLPYLIRTRRSEVPDGLINQHLDEDFTFIGAAYWNKLANFAPRIFYNPMPASSVAFAQVRVFVPHRRLVWVHLVPGNDEFGGMPGNFPPLPPPGDGDTTPPSPPGSTPPSDGWVVGRQPGVSEAWNLLNQHWTCQLVLATHASIPTILQQPPAVPGIDPQQYQLPDLAGLQMDQLGAISMH